MRRMLAQEDVGFVAAAVATAPAQRRRESAVTWWKWMGRWIEESKFAQSSYLPNSGIACGGGGIDRGYQLQRGREIVGGANNVEADGGSGGDDADGHALWEHPPPHGAWILLTKAPTAESEQAVVGGWTLRVCHNAQLTGEAAVRLERVPDEKKRGQARSENENPATIWQGPWQTGMQWVPVVAQATVPAGIGAARCDFRPRSDGDDAQPSEWLIKKHGSGAGQRWFVYYRHARRAQDHGHVDDSVTWAVSCQNKAKVLNCIGAQLSADERAAVCEAVAAKIAGHKKEQKKEQNMARPTRQEEYGRRAQKRKDHKQDRQEEYGRRAQKRKDETREHRKQYEARADLRRQRAQKDQWELQHRLRQRQQSEPSDGNPQTDPESLLDLYHRLNGHTISDALEYEPDESATEEEKEQWREHALEMIERHVAVSPQRTEDILRAYHADGAERNLYACASCGRREASSARYHRYRLDELPPQFVMSDHMVATRESLGSLELLNDDGVSTRTVDMRQMASGYCDDGEGGDGRWYHLHSRLVDAPGEQGCADCASAMFCETCSKAVGNAGNGDDSTPAFSLARGVDFGTFEPLGLTAPSALEQLVLSDVRPYGVVVKVAAAGSGESTPDAWRRLKMHGHWIAFPHEGKREAAQAFRSMQARVDDVARKVRVFLLGPEGSHDVLYARLKQMPSWDLNAVRVYNYLSIRRHIERNTDYGDPDLASSAPDPEAIPSAAELKVLFDDLHARLEGDACTSNVTHIEDAAMQRATDQAGVRAESGVLTGSTEEAIKFAADTTSEGTEDAVLSFMGAAEATVAAKETDGADNPDDDGPAQGQPAAPLGLQHITLTRPEPTAESITAGALEAVKALRVSRDPLPVSEFENNGRNLMETFWFLFPLQRGLEAFRGTIPPGATKHLMQHYSTRFQGQSDFVLYLANQQMRHTALQSVSRAAKVRNDRFCEFTELVNSPTFDAELAAATEAPKSRRGRAFLKQILPLLAIAATPVKWSSAERGACISRMLAMARRFGPPSCFLTIAPDDVHDPTSVRLALTHATNSEFPALMGEFMEALQTRSADFQHAGSSLFGDNMEDSLQRIAAEHPGATSMMYSHMMKAVLGTLFGLPPTGSHGTRKSVAVDERESFLNGTPVAFFAVTETSGRKALHMHCLLFGGATPDLLSSATKHKDLMAAIKTALASQYCCELPLAIHVADRTRRVLKVAARRPVVCAHPPVRADDSNADAGLSEEFKRDVHLTVAALQIHVCQPNGACAKKPAGECGCRFGMPCGHPIESTRVVQMEGTQASKETEVIPGYVPCDGLCSSPFCSINTGSLEIKWSECDASSQSNGMWACDESSDDEEETDMEPQPGEHKRKRSADSNEEMPFGGGDDLPAHAKMLLSSSDNDEQEDAQQEGADELLEDGRPWAYRVLIPREERVIRSGWLVFELKRASLWPTEDQEGKTLEAPLAAARMFPRENVRERRKFLRTLSPEELKKRFRELFEDMPADVHEELARDEWQQVRERLETANDRQMRELILQWSTLLCANASVTAYGYALTAAVRCNTAHLLLGAREAARNAMFYMVKYLTKDSTELSASLSVLNDVRERSQRWESRADDRGTETRNAKYFLEKAVNQLHGELSDTQAAALLLGEEAHLTSESFVWGAPWQVANLARELALDPHLDGFDADADVFDGYDDEGDTDEYEFVGARSEWIRDQQAQEESGPGYSKCYTDANGASVPVTLAEHYRLRGTELAGYNYMEWQACINVVPIPDGEGLNDPDGAAPVRQRGAKASGCFRFHRAHPLYDSHWQQIRRKVQVVMHTGPMPPTEPQQLGAGKKVPEKWLGARWKFAAYMVANFVPWRVDADEDDGNRPMSLTPESLEAWRDGLKRTAVVVTEPTTQQAARQRTLARGRLFELQNYVHALKVSKEAKHVLNQWRMRNRRGWEHGESGSGAGAADGDGDAGAKAGADALGKESDKAKAAAEAQKNAALKDPEKLKKVREDKGENQRWIDQSLRNQGLTLPPLDDTPPPADAAPPEAAGMSAYARYGLFNESVSSTPLQTAYDDMQQFPFATPAAQAMPTPAVPGANPNAVNLNLENMPPEIAELSEPDMQIAVAEWEAAKAVARSVGAPEPLPPLNHEQRVIAKEVLLVLQGMERARQAAPGAPRSVWSPAVRVHKLFLLFGAAGTGKTLLIRRLEDAMDRLGLGRMALTAFAGSACVELGNAITTLSLLSIPLFYGERELDPLTENQQIKFERYVGLIGSDLDQLRLLVVDEVSMISPALLHHMDQRLRTLLKNKHEKFGGLVLLAAGDFYQKQAVSSTSLHAALVQATTPIPSAKGVLAGKKKRGKSGAAGTAAAVAGASVNGVQLFKALRRMKLTVQNRFRMDREYGEDVSRMRDHKAKPTVSDRFVSTMQVMSEAERSDPRWMFESVGVVGNAERHYLNAAKVYLWARVHGVTLFRWKLPLESARAATLDRETTDALYEEEPSLWGYFAKGAPGFLIQDNLSQGRGLVNGTKVRLHSLTLKGGASDMAKMAAQAGPGAVVTLAEPPKSVNVTPLVRAHFVERLRPYSIAPPNEDVVVPIMGRNGALAKEINSAFAAAELPGMSKLNVKGHIVELGFAITDFKSQGKTMDRIVLSLASRPKNKSMKAFELSTVYVLATRVTTRAGLRALESDESGFKHLQRLTFPNELVVWDGSYTDTGYFNEDMAHQAAKDLGATLAAREKKQKADNFAKKKKERQEKRKEQQQGAKRAAGPAAAARAKPPSAPLQAKAAAAPQPKAAVARANAKPKTQAPRPTKPQVAAAKAAHPGAARLPATAATACASKSNTWLRNSCHIDAALTAFEAGVRAAAQLLGRPFVHALLPAHYTQANPPRRDPARAGMIKGALLRWLTARDVIAQGATPSAWTAAADELSTARNDVRDEVNRAFLIEANKNLRHGLTETVVAARVRAKSGSFGSAYEDLGILIGNARCIRGQAGAATTTATTTAGPHGERTPPPPAGRAARVLRSASRSTFDDLQRLPHGGPFDFAGGRIVRVCGGCQTVLPVNPAKDPEYRSFYVSPEAVRLCGGNLLTAFARQKLDTLLHTAPRANRCRACGSVQVRERLHLELSGDDGSDDAAPPLLCITWDWNAPGSRPRFDAASRDAATLESPNLPHSSTYQLVALVQFSQIKQHFFTDVRGDGTAASVLGASEWTRFDGCHGLDPNLDHSGPEQELQDRYLGGRGRPIPPPTGAAEAEGYAPYIAIYCRAQAARRGIEFG